jgi:hypothetical protein
MKEHGKQSMVLPGSTPAMLVRGACLAVIFFTAIFSLSAADSDSAYAKWVKPWTDRPVNSPAMDGAGLKLIVSCVQGETNSDAVASMTPVERLDLAYHIRVSATEVATNGCCRSYVISNTNPQTSKNRWLWSGDLQQLDALLGKLPDDQSQLPPPGNRIVMQVLADGRWQVHVYDGNKLPPEVADVLSLLAKPYSKLF